MNLPEVSNIIFKPLEQFTIRNVVKRKVAPKTYFSFNYMDVMLWFNILGIIGLIIHNKSYVINRGTLNNIQAGFHKFLRNMLITQLSFTGESYFLAILVLFFVILVFNLLGMIPGFFCVTSQLGVALSLSFSLFFGCVYFIVRNCGLVYLINLFIPQGVPKILLPLLFVLELISFVSRALSLAIRLFANMVAGHSLLHILAGALTKLGNAFKSMDDLFVVVFTVPYIVILLVYFLEVGIAFLQAYVFVMLSLIYLKDTLIFIPKKVDKVKSTNELVDSLKKAYGKNS